MPPIVPNTPHGAVNTPHDTITTRTDAINTFAGDVTMLLDCLNTLQPYIYLTTSVANIAPPSLNTITLYPKQDTRCPELGTPHQQHDHLHCPARPR